MAWAQSRSPVSLTGVSEDSIEISQCNELVSYCNSRYSYYCCVQPSWAKWSQEVSSLASFLENMCARPFGCMCRSMYPIRSQMHSFILHSSGLAFAILNLEIPTSSISTTRWA
jgi:hypothetical protein